MHIFFWKYKQETDSYFWGKEVVFEGEEGDL